MDRASSEVPEGPAEGGPLDRIITWQLADPTVAAVLVNHDGRLWIERDDGRLVAGTVIVPRPEAERFVGAIGPRTTPGSKRGRAFIVEDPARDIKVTVVPASRFQAPCLAVRRRTPPRLDRSVAAGRLGAPEASRLRELLRDAGNLLVAGPTARARRLVVCTLLAEAGELGRRILHVQEDEWFRGAAPGIVTSIKALRMLSRHPLTVRAGTQRTRTPIVTLSLILMPLGRMTGPRAMH